MVMRGYWNRPEATAEVLRDGWLYTGDLGFLDAKNNLFLTGRKKELIVLSNGKNIYPEEIEDHYQQSPYIKEICVLGLEATPGDPSSERLHGIIVPNFDVLREKKIVNAKEVIRFDVEGLSAQLPSTKRLGSYEIWQEDLPRTTTRKLKRFEIEKKVREGSKTGGFAGESPVGRPLSDADMQWLARPEVAAGLRLIRQAARNKPDTLHPADNLELDLGLDSMQRVELLVALEQELGGNVEESRLAGIYTVRDLLDAIFASAAEQPSGDAAGNRFAGWQAVLDEPIDDPEVLALSEPARFADRMIYLAFRITQIVALDLFHLRIEGIENLPLQGPCILSSNHQSFLDPVILASLLPWEVFGRVFAVGTSEIFGSGFLRLIARWLRVIVLDPDANLIPAMRAGSYGLKHGRVLILYPEGERSIDGTPKTFKKGAAILAIHQRVPIVPIAIDGFQKAWPRGKSFQGFLPLRIKFGKPISPPPVSQSPEQSYEAMTTELKNRVVAMWDQLRAQEKSPANLSSEP
jgi:long-chain acyl-CoA synthetase